MSRKKPPTISYATVNSQETTRGTTFGSAFKNNADVIPADYNTDEPPKLGVKASIRGDYTQHMPSKNQQPPQTINTDLSKPGWAHYHQHDLLLCNNGGAIQEPKAKTAILKCLIEPPKQLTKTEEKLCVQTMLTLGQKDSLRNNPTAFTALLHIFPKNIQEECINQYKALPSKILSTADVTLLHKRGSGPA